MDVKQYFRKIRELEETLTEEYPVVVSLDTADGGKGGVLAEVSRTVAARMIIDGRAVLATPAEKEKYLQQQAAARKQAERTELARRVQVAIISDRELGVMGSSKRINDSESVTKQE